MESAAVQAPFFAILFPILVIFFIDPVMNLTLILLAEFQFGKDKSGQGQYDSQKA